MKILQDWKPFEIAWLILSVSIITILGFIWDDTLLGFISSISGIICVVLVAKGKIANVYFGIVQALTYAYISYGYGLYGEAMLNAIFYFPMQFIILYVWMKNSKNKDERINGEDIYAKRLNLKQWIILIPITILAIIVYMQVLTHINAQQVRLDSIAVVLSVIAQFLMLFRYAEQWVFFITINVLTVTLWFVTLIQTGGNDWTIFAMWVCFLVNSIYGYINWRKLSQ